jgi:rRNA processing protein Krr1/Pno1
MITFCRNYHARLLPLAHGVLYLASHVPIDIININCRLGAMPSLETIKATLRGISDQKAAKIRRMGRDTAVVVKDGKNMIKANIIIFDNSQHFRRQRERRIGRENTMVIGISATSRCSFHLRPVIH